MSDVQKLKEKLFKNTSSGWEGMKKEKKEEIFSYCNNYMKFLNNSKTEREIVKSAKKLIEEKGFKNIREYETLKPGDKVYYNNREKSMYIAVIGQESIEKGINVIGAHADSPRLDLKPNPLYEDTGFVYFKTHYYGGIKKYQWTTIPLAIHGVIVKTNGEKIEITIGEEETDPIFTITDLLPHLAQEQMERKLKEGVKGEDLNLLIGSIPYQGENGVDSVKLNIMSILNEKYGITEIDFTSSELEVVPAFRARSMGLDNSMVAAYGQDDKVCVYTSLTAMMELEKPRTADVDAAYDPIYANVFEKNNAGFFGRGLGLNKYTGARGKSGASDANAEFIAMIRNIFEKENIRYEFAELGRVDVGGGGTIAYILANKGVDVIDAGVPVLSMHAPYEVTSKFDIYEAYRAYKTFWNN